MSKIDYNKDVERKDLDVLTPEEVAKEQLFVSASNRAENVQGKVAQRQQSLFDVEDRFEQDKFNLGKAWGQAVMGTPSINSH